MRAIKALFLILISSSLLYSQAKIIGSVEDQNGKILLVFIYNGKIYMQTNDIYPATVILRSDGIGNVIYLLEDALKDLKSGVKTRKWWRKVNDSGEQKVELFVDEKYVRIKLKDCINEFITDEISLDKSQISKLISILNIARMVCRGKIFDFEIWRIIQNIPVYYGSAGCPG